MDYYSEISEGYEELHGEEQDAKLREFLARVDVSERDVVLDVGCGTGRSARLLASEHWHGLEPSDGLREQSRVRERIKSGRAEDMPFPDGSFDVVLCLTALQNFDDPRKALEEVRRVCKRGGIIMISFLKRSGKREELDRLVREILVVGESWESDKDVMYVARRS